jgi:DNA-binding response OmpR family regulator
MAKKVLVVDDHVDVVKMVGLLLAREGYEIIAAQSGDQALVKAQTDKPDVVILDIMMPDMDGYEVCRRLRANPNTSHLPILMFTAKAMPSDKVAGFEAGADDYLTKPVHPAELIARVETALLRSARQTTERLAMRGKVLGFLGSKGGVGTTNLVVNIAVALASEVAQGKQIVLADLQSGMAALALHLGLRQGGLTRLLNQPVESLEPKSVEAQLEEYKLGVRLLSGQIEPPGTAVSISPAQADAIIRNLGAVADYVLLDLGAGLGEANRHSLSLCYHIVVTVEPQHVALMLAQSLLGEMTGPLNLPSHKISVAVINKAAAGATFTKDTLKELLQHEICGIVTPAPELALQSAERGIPMVLLQPDSLVTRQFRSIAEYLAKV